MNPILSEDKTNDQATHFNHYIEANHLFSAAGKGNIDEIKKYLKRVAVDVRMIYHQTTPFHNAVTNNQFEAAKLLLEEGADVNAPGTLSRRPIHSAILYGNVDMVNLLLNHPNIDITATHGGKPPLALAVRYGKNKCGKEREKYDQIITLLIQHGSNPHQIADRIGRTIYQKAHRRQKALMDKLNTHRD